MSKLREKFGNVILNHDHNKQCEQITDDFSAKLLLWMGNLKENSLNDEIDINQSKENIAKQLQQYFKNNIYGKE